MLALISSYLCLCAFYRYCLWMQLANQGATISSKHSVPPCCLNKSLLAQIMILKASKQECILIGWSGNRLSSLQCAFLNITKNNCINEIVKKLH